LHHKTQVMITNEQLITRFYSAFARKDFRGMQGCYAENVTFSDNAFPDLKGKRAWAMWHMLCNAGGDMTLTFSNVKADDTTGSADWVATYTFSLTGRKVVNRIHANFNFADGKIQRHTDSFNFWKWSSQAFGLKGQLLGWAPFFKSKIQSVTRDRLKAFIDKHPEYK
jgi:ketosteroid isomerase-like protein